MRSVVGDERPAPRIARVVIPSDPGWQDRPRAGLAPSRRTLGLPTPRLRDTARSKSWKSLVRAYLREACRAPLVGAVELTVTAVFECPASDHRKRTPRPERWKLTKPDADNILKAIADAGNGVLYHDDGQVARVVVEKRIAAQGDPPRVEIQARELGGLPG